MTRQILLYFLLTCVWCNYASQAQNKVAVRQVRASELLEIRKPILLEEENIKGEKFDAYQALNAEVIHPTFEQLPQILKASDTEGSYLLPKTTADYGIQFLSFRIEGFTFEKTTLNVQTPSLFELYLNGKKINSKKQKETSFETAQPITTRLTITPGNLNEITIKYLSDGSSTDNEQIQLYFTDINESKLHINATKKRLTQYGDVIFGKRVQGAELSPSGRYALFTYLTVLPNEKTYWSKELVNIQTGQKSVIEATRAQWMPQSDAYLHFKQEGAFYQLIKTDAQTGASSLVIDKLPQGNYQLTPDEKNILFTTSENGDDRKGDLKIVINPDDRMSGYLNKSYISLFQIDKGINNRLTFTKSGSFISDISPNSKKILVASSRDQITEHPFYLRNYYEIDLENYTVDTLFTDTKFIQSVHYSPNSTQLLIKGTPNAFDNIGLTLSDPKKANYYDGQLFILDSVSGEVTPITKSFHPAVDRVLTWNSKTNLIYFIATDQDCKNVFSYDPKQDKFNRLDLEEETISSFELSTDGSQALYIGSGVNNSNKAYAYQTKNKKSKLLADPMAPVFDHLELGEVKAWNFTASDGTTIIGRYHLPPHFDASQSYPLIVYYYGGTTPAGRSYDSNYPPHVFAAKGYVVYVIQPSGTIGFGQEFSSRHVNTWGLRVAEDIIEGTTQFADEHSFINKEKIGCIGASYGGFMTQYLQTQTSIFAAAVSHAGISSITSYWGEGYWGYSYGSIASAHSYPWDSKEMYTTQSPLYNADKINTPLLLVHGTEDTNVPVGESIQMYNALRILGKPVEFVQVKGEDHHIKKPNRRLAWNNTICSWFDLWLKGDASWWNSMYPERKYNQ